MTYSANLIPTMTSATAPSGTASADSEYSATYAAWKAFNHANASSADNWISTVTSFPHWLAYEFPSATLPITQYLITARVDADAYPSAWTFEGWNGSTWDTLDTRTGISSWTAGETKTYAVSNNTSYAKYRLNFTTGKYATHVSIGEWELMRTLAPPTVTTAAISAITASGGTSGGTVTLADDGITDCGVCWNTAGTPTIADSHVHHASPAVEAFEENLTGLVPGTTYHVRAFATGAGGTSYGAEVDFLHYAPGAPPGAHRSHIYAQGVTVNG